MNKMLRRQKGFVLIVAMIFLTAVTLLVVSGMGASAMGERMSGNHMDRIRAELAAEQAITQGLAKLQANAITCLSGCDNTTVTGIGAKTTGTSLPGVWSDTNAQDAAKATGQGNSAKYLISWLSDSSFTAGKTDCAAFSVMGKGFGLDTATTVVMQAVAYLCPTD